MSRRLFAPAVRQECDAGWASQLLLRPRVEVHGGDGDGAGRLGGGDGGGSGDIFVVQGLADMGDLILTIHSQTFVFEFLFERNLQKTSKVFNEALTKTILIEQARRAAIPRNELIVIFVRLNRDLFKHKSKWGKGGTMYLERRNDHEPVIIERLSHGLGMYQRAKDFEKLMRDLLWKVSVKDWKDSGASLMFSFWLDYHYAFVEETLDPLTEPLPPLGPLRDFGPFYLNPTLLNGMHARNNYMAMRYLCHSSMSTSKPINSLKLHEFVSRMPRNFAKRWSYDTLNQKVLEEGDDKDEDDDGKEEEFDDDHKMPRGLDEDGKQKWRANQPKDPRMPPKLTSKQEKQWRKRQKWLEKPVFLPLDEMYPRFDAHFFLRRQPENEPRRRAVYTFGKGFMYCMKFQYLELETLLPSLREFKVEMAPFVRGFVFTGGSLVYSRVYQTTGTDTRAHSDIRMRLKGSFVWTDPNNLFQSEVTRLIYRRALHHLKALRDVDLFVTTSSDGSIKVDSYNYNLDARGAEFETFGLGETFTHFSGSAADGTNNRDPTRGAKLCRAQMFARGFGQIKDNAISTLNDDLDVWSLVTPLHTAYSLFGETIAAASQVPIAELRNMFVQVKLDLDGSGAYVLRRLKNHLYLYRKHVPPDYMEQWTNGRKGMLGADSLYGAEALPLLANLLRQISVSDWYGSGWPFFFGLWQQHWRLRNDFADDPSNRATMHTKLNYRAFQHITSHATDRANEFTRFYATQNPKGGARRPELLLTDTQRLVMKQNAETFKRFVSSMPKPVADWSSEAARTNDGGLDLSEALAHYAQTGLTEKKMHFVSSDCPVEMQSVGGAHQFGGGFMYCQATDYDDWGAVKNQMERAKREKAIPPKKFKKIAVMREFPLRSVTPRTGMQSIYFTFQSCEFELKQDAADYELTFRLQGCFVWSPSLNSTNFVGSLSETSLEDTDLLVTYRGSYKVDEDSGPYLAQQTLRVDLPGGPHGQPPLFERTAVEKIAPSGTSFFRDNNYPKEMMNTFIFTGAQTLIN
jgi:hypothetical protein